MKPEPRAGARFQRPIRFVRQRFSPEGYLGLHLTIGLLVVLLAGWCFSEIAEDLSHVAGLVAFDQQVAQWSHTHSSVGLVRLAQVMTIAGSVSFLTLVSVICAIVSAVRRAWDWLLALALTMLGGSLLNIMLKHFFQRERPVLENPFVTLTSYGFPSGHTMGATLFYGLVAIFAVHYFKSLLAGVLTAAFAVLIIGVVGLTRIMLGAHYLTDVLAAIAAGSAWLAFSWTAAETFRKRRRHQRMRCSQASRERSGSRLQEG